MAKGSILTLPVSPLQSITSTHQYMTWGTEQKLGAGLLDYFNDAVDPNFMIMPVDATASRCEMFMYAEETGISKPADGFYIGQIDSINANWYGIMRFGGNVARGFRSGLIPYTPGEKFGIRSRTFNASATWNTSRTYLGVLIDPVPIAVVSTSKASTSYGSYPNVKTKFLPTISYDPWGVHSGGTFTAPENTECMVASINASSDPADSADGWYYLHHNGVEVARYYHDGSLRSPAVGCFGLRPCAPTDTFEFYGNKLGASIIDDLSISVEFY